MTALHATHRDLFHTLVPAPLVKYRGEVGTASEMVDLPGHPPRQLPLRIGARRAGHASTRQWNDVSGPVTWVTTAPEILAKVVRKPRVTRESGH